MSVPHLAGGTSHKPAWVRRPSPSSSGFLLFILGALTTASVHSGTAEAFSAVSEQEDAGALQLLQDQDRHPSWPYPDADLHVVQAGQLSTDPVDEEDDAFNDARGPVDYVDPDREDATRDESLEEHANARPENEDSPFAKYLSLIGENADNDDIEPFAFMQTRERTTRFMAR